MMVPVLTMVWGITEDTVNERYWSGGRGVDAACPLNLVITLTPHCSRCCVQSQLLLVFGET